MQSIFPLILVALGGAAMVVMRGDRIVIGALLLQWLGLAFVCAGVGGAAPGLNKESAVEFITALACGLILSLTLRSLRSGDAKRQSQSLSDYLLPATVTLLGGVAGVGFASIFPIGNIFDNSLVFYWTMIAGALALVLEGTRSPVKLAVGLLALLNAVALLIVTLQIEAPGSVLLGLVAAVRLGLALLAAYSWLMLKQVFGEFSLEPIFGGSEQEVVTVEQEPQLLAGGSESPITIIANPLEGLLTDE